MVSDYYSNLFHCKPHQQNPVLFEWFHLEGLLKYLNSVSTTFRMFSVTKPVMIMSKIFYEKYLGILTGE